MINSVTKEIKLVPIEKFSEEELIKGLEQGNRKIISFLYKRNMATIKKMANQYPKMIFEAEDVLQEGMARMIMNVRSGKFLGKSSIHSYLYSICKNICFKQYAGETFVTFDESTPDLAEENNSEYFDLLQLILTAKQKLDEKCLEIIDLRFRLTDLIERSNSKAKLMEFEQIAQLIEIKADNARQRFSRCLEKFISILKNTPGLENKLIHRNHGN